MGVILVNLSAEPQAIEPGERIAQLVFAPVTQAGGVDDAENEPERDLGQPDAKGEEEQRGDRLAPIEPDRP